MRGKEREREGERGRERGREKEKKRVRERDWWVKEESHEMIFKGEGGGIRQQQ